MLHGYLPAIVGGLWVTLSAAGLSLALACVFGLLGAAAKLSGSRPMCRLAGLDTTVIRDLPDGVLLLAILCGGQILLNDLFKARGWDFIDALPLAAGVPTIGIICGAYLTETFRGAILAVPRGQAEAGLAFGMSRLQVRGAWCCRRWCGMPLQASPTTGWS